ncbi:MAG: M48 family metallopeptidase [Thermodesulfovibrionales bacterium]
MDIKIEKIIRTQRKTIALHITDDATLTVRAPLKVSDKTIMGVISKHANWIKQKTNEIITRDPRYARKEFVSGEGFLFLGRYYRLEVVDDQDEPLKFENKFYLSKSVLPRARELFIDWYKNMAYEKISERVELYACNSGLKYKKVNITDAQKRWGSCGHNGNLNFSWWLIMAPLPVLDYVVVHELAHIEEKNHTRSFWNKVKILMPDYEKHKDWLRENGYLLKI